MLTGAPEYVITTMSKTVKFLCKKQGKNIEHYYDSVMLKTAKIQ